MRCNSPVRHLGAFAILASTAMLLAGCEETGVGANSRASAPIPPQTLALMQEKSTSANAPVLIRTYKKESELEIWKMKSDGRYALLKTYPMCRWSGQLGPKVREGDRQVPEGFYSITPAQMNPNSAYYLSFNVGYPNAYDRANGHSGGSIMVHGICSSAGCFSMTDPQIGEIYAIAREGFSGGQREIQMQSYPFRMTAEHVAKYRLDQNIGFWKQLKEGADNFEVTQQEVTVGVCDMHYVFNATPADGSRLDPNGPCPQLKRNEAIRSLVAAKEKRDQSKVAELIAQGVRPVHTIYADGGQHPHFASLSSYASRPEALAQGPIDVALDEGKSKGRASPLIQMAALKMDAQPATADLRPGDPADVTGTTEAPAKPQTSMFSHLFGAKPTEPSPSASTFIVNEPSVPQFADVPLPPRRNEVGGTIQAEADLSSPTTPGAVKHQIMPTSEKSFTGATRALPYGVSAVAQADR
jgi:murein L,D-transpeptidase YafK